MAEVRLSQLTKQFNIGLSTLVEFLSSKGVEVEMSSLPQVEIPARHIRAFMTLVLRTKTSQFLITSKTMQQ